MELQGADFQAQSDGINTGSESIGSGFVEQSDNGNDASTFAGTYNVSKGVQQCGGKKKSKPRSRKPKKVSKKRKNKTKKRPKKRKNRSRK